MACDDRPVCISTFYLWILGEEKYSYFVLVIFYVATFFLVVSAIDYSLLKHIVINDDL